MVARMAVESDPSLNTACLSAYQVGGDAAEGNREIVEGFDIRVSQGFAIDQETDLLAGVQSAGQREPFAQPQQDRIRKRNLVLFPAEGQILVRDCSAQDHIPILCFHQFVQLLRSFPAGVQTSHQAAHAGAGEVIDGNVMVLEPLQHPDMCQAERAPAFERHPDRRPVP